MCTHLWEHLDRAARRRCIWLAAELGLVWPASLVLALIVLDPGGNAWLRGYLGLDDDEGC